MNILDYDNFVSEKLDIKPVSKNTLVSFSDGYNLFKSYLKRLMEDLKNDSDLKGEIDRLDMRASFGDGDISGLTYSIPKTEKEFKEMWDDLNERFDQGDFYDDGEDGEVYMFYDVYYNDTESNSADYVDHYLYVYCNRAEKRYRFDEG